MNDGMSSWEAAGCRNSAMALLLSTWIADMIVCSVHKSSIAGNPESEGANSVGSGAGSTPIKSGKFGKRRSPTSRL
jgi:hypothetical protein